jgi:hypothetical protein
MEQSWSEILGTLNRRGKSYLWHGAVLVRDTWHPEQEETRVISGREQSWSEILGTLKKRRQELSQAWSSPGQRYWAP